MIIFASLVQPSKSVSSRNKQPVDDITTRLSKPEIKRIILRRKSDLIRKELNDLNKSISIENIAQDSMEIVEEIKQDNSTYLVHKRQKNPTDDLELNSSFENSYFEDSFTGDIQQMDHQDGRTSDNIIPRSSDPLSTSSPTSQKNFTGNNGDNGGVVSSSTVEEDIDKSEKETSQRFSAASSLTIKGSMDDLESKAGQTSYGTSNEAFEQSLDESEIKPGEDKSETSNNIANNGENKEKVRIKRTHPVSRTSTINSRRSQSSKYLDGELNSMKKNKTYLHLPSANESLSRYSGKRSVSVLTSVSNLSPDMRSQACSYTTDGELSSINEEMLYDSKIFMMPLIPYPKRKLKMCKYVCVFFIALCIIACAVGGFLHFYVGQFPQDVTLNQGDIKFIETSTLFCSGIKARSDQSEVHLISFDKEKDEAKKILYSVSTSFMLHPSYIWKRGFFLLAGSKVTIDIQTNFLVKVMVFEGEKSLSLWTDRKYSETYLTSELCCSNKPDKKDSISFTAKHTNTYFLVLYSGVEVIPVDITTLELHFDRVTYTFSYYSSSCNAKTGETCLLTQSFNSHDTVAIEVPLQKNGEDISTMSTFRYECIARIWFYCLFFGGISFSCIFLIITIYYLSSRLISCSETGCCKDSAKSRRTCNSCYNDYGHNGKSIELQSQFSGSVSRARSISSVRMSEYSGTSGRPYSVRTHRLNRGRNGSRLSSVNNQAIKEIGITNDIAAIYREEEEQDKRTNYGPRGSVSLKSRTYSEI